jgi:ATP-dependent DNA helicase RecG (EC 3.6.1.-)
MRPHVLTPLFAAASTLPGIGPKTGKLLDRLLGSSNEHGLKAARVVDLLFHLPHSVSTGAISRRSPRRLSIRW